MEADGLFVHQQRSDASLIPGIHTNGKLCFWNELPTLAYLGWSSPGSAGVSPASLFLQTASHPGHSSQSAPNPPLRGSLPSCQDLCGQESPRERGRLARILIPANSLPATATPSQSAPNPPLRGSLPSCQALCGRESPRERGRLARNLIPQTASRPRPLPRKAHQTRLYGVLFPRARLPCAGENPPGSAGVSPASLFLPSHGHSLAKCKPAFTGFSSLVPLCGRESPRERGRLARNLIPANSLPATATPSQSAPNPPLRGSLPSCQALCGRDARVPGGSCAGGTPALPGGLLCRPHPKRGSRSRSWRSLGASRSLADRRGCRMGHSIPISGSSQRMAIWSSAS